MFAIRTVVAALLGCALAGTAAAARPLIIEESSIIQSPDPAIYPSFGFEVATNGEEALIAGFDDKTNVEVWQYYALLYRKVNGQWAFQRVLQHYEHFYDSYSYPLQFALRGNLAVQNSVGGDARADIGTPTDDQVVQAKIRPIAYSAPSGTSERWTGLMARYVDERNYYYVSLRSGNTVSLRKVINGTITPLASAPFPVTLNTPYRVRLEAVSNQLRVYVNDVLRLQATDASLARGSGGLVTFKAAAHFDNYDAYQP